MHVTWYTASDWEFKKQNQNIPGIITSKNLVSTPTTFFASQLNKPSSSG